ncbi:hypothetical protein FHX58_004305 [Paraburkholderia tropica]|nr:hypothetical protein [Paraburkholderia tropica]MBB2981448.1 hypothetical protein [Paraburkholderia tropica]
MNGRHQCSNGTPDDGNGPDPASRAVASQGDVGWNLEQYVADKEDAGAKAECGIGQSDVRIHAQGRIANVRAIKEADEIQQQNQRRNTKLGEKTIKYHS